MLKQFVVLRTFLYEGLVRYAGTALWLKPSASGDYVRQNYIKEYVPPAEVPVLLTKAEQEALLKKLKDIELEEVEVKDAKGNRVKRS